MVGLLIGVVASRIVTADHGPAGLIRGVFSRRMKKIAVEEEHIARIHLEGSRFREWLDRQQWMRCRDRVKGRRSDTSNRSPDARPRRLRSSHPS